MGLRQSGVYQVHLLGKFQRNVYCVLDRYGGGWMAFQRRFDGTVDFFPKKWDDYKRGFGDSAGEYWLGNEMLHLLTTSESQDYMVEATSFQNEVQFKKIRNVVINGEDDEYRINYDLESIDDTSTSIPYGLHMQGMKFSTADNKNDENASGNCAAQYGGWWHNDCHHVGMNGRYRSEANHAEATSNIEWDYSANGIMWIGWKGFGVSLKASLLMIRPSSF